jgi:hypothetical protein
MDLLPELFHKIEENFTQHLELEGNERILFSGAFGIGKTTFINHYFENGAGKDYNVIHLFPVNYSVLNNEDIFTYIKYDIIYELLEKKLLNLEKTEFNYLDKLPDFAISNLTKVSSLLLLLIPKMGKQLFQLSDEVQKLGVKFHEYVSKKKPKTDVVAKLLDSFTMKDGQLYEFNILSLIIFETLKELKQNGKKNILIIDDLDRIDPNHIFRLFNVFAAHFDHRDKRTENKFGFDHIILVCDIKNIKHIYQHSYGVSTDFNGYVDKFFSREVFYFDNYENIVSFLKSYFKNIKFVGHNDSFTSYLEKDDFLRANLVFVFSNFVLNKEINLRSLLRDYQKKKNVDCKEIVLNNSRKISSYEYSIFPFIKIISTFFVDGKALKHAVSNCSKSNNKTILNSDSILNLFGELIYGLDILINGRSSNHRPQETLEYLDIKRSHNFRYIIIHRNTPFVHFQSALMPIEENKEQRLNEKYIEEGVNYFELLDDLIEILIDKNYLG